MRVAATRSARSGSSGQPITAGSCAVVTDPRRKASTRRPRPWRSLPSNRDCGAEIPAEPRTGSGSGQPAAAQAQPPAANGHSSQRGARLVQTLAPRSNTAWPHRQPSSNGTAASATAWASRGPQGSAGQRPGHEAAGVGVDEADVVLEGEHEHRSGGVGPDARQGEEGVEVFRKGPAVVGHHGCCTPMEVDGPAVVPEAFPRPHHVSDGRCRAAGRRREPFEERGPTGLHPRHLGLLEHQLRHQHRPGITGRPPRQIVPAVVGPPVQEGVLHHHTWVR